MDLREELPSDRESVRDIHLRAFGDHGVVVADLVDTLRVMITPADGLSLVAELDGITRAVSALPWSETG
jgi:putative acetyltransferase